MLLAHGVIVNPEWFQCLGYSSEAAVRALSARCDTLGRLPAALFVNGIPALEGALEFTSSLGRGLLWAPSTGIRLRPMHHLI